MNKGSDRQCPSENRSYILKQETNVSGSDRNCSDHEPFGDFGLHGEGKAPLEVCQHDTLPECPLRGLWYTTVGDEVDHIHTLLTLLLLSNKAPPTFLSFSFVSFFCCMLSLIRIVCVSLGEGCIISNMGNLQLKKIRVDLLAFCWNILVPS